MTGCPFHWTAISVKAVKGTPSNHSPTLLFLDSPNDAWTGSYPWLLKNKTYLLTYLSWLVNTPFSAGEMSYHVPYRFVSYWPDGALNVYVYGLTRLATMLSAAASSLSAQLDITTLTVVDDGSWSANDNTINVLSCSGSSFIQHIQRSTDHRPPSTLSVASAASIYNFISPSKRR